MTKLTRRGWLKRTTALGAGGLLGLEELPTQAAEPTNALKFGFSLYGMKGLQVADALRLCSAIGYNAVELALMPGWSAEPKQLSAENRRDLRKRLDDSGLALVGLMENLFEPADDSVHLANLDRLKSAAELGNALAPKAPPVIETVLGGKPGQWEQVKDRLVERLRAWAKVAADAPMIIAIKPHVANALHTPEGALWLVRQVNSPWLKLAFDYSHFVLRELPMDRTMAALLPQSVFIHVKDARGNASKFDFLLPGEGGIDYPEFFQQLRTAGYHGPVVVEVSGQISNRRGYDAEAAARRSYAKLAPAMKKAGLWAR